MKLSRRTFLAASGLAALPGLPLRVTAASVPLAQQVGELWGMPYLAQGALGNPVPQGRVPE